MSVCESSDQRKTLSSHPSAYVDTGFDATVSWGGPDYKFTNNTEYPIKIVSSYGGGVVTCVLYGTKLKDFKVSLSSEVVATYDYETEYEDDDTLEEGEEKVSVTGITDLRFRPIVPYMMKMVRRYHRTGIRQCL